MKVNGYIIRPEKKYEQRTVKNLVRESFWNVYRPGAVEHFLLHVMRRNKDFVPSLNLVMEMGGKIIGQVVFVRSEIKADDGRSIPTLTLGPICIANQYKRQGLSKMLLDRTFDLAREQGFGAVLFEGNIDF